jgi:hypothetical protein
MPWTSGSALDIPLNTIALDAAPGMFVEGVPPIDDIGRPIDELAFVLATDHLSITEKVRMLEQWRYDELLMQNGATEGLGCERADGALLQQINKALLRLHYRCH